MSDELQSEGQSSFEKLLAEMGERAEQMLADFLAQEPQTIEIAGRVPYLPRMVLDGLAAIKDQLNERSQAAIDEWQEKERRRHREMWEAMERSARAFQASLPPNWHEPEIEFPDLELVEALQLQEGLPLAWVPPNGVLQGLLTLETAEDRTALIEHEAAQILTACIAQLSTLSAELTQEWRASAEEAARAMEAGYWRAGQALAAIALDTAADEFIRSSYKNATHHYDRNGNPTPPGSSPSSLPTWRDIDYPRALLVMYGIWGAFKQFWTNRGDLVPAQFSRHGTIHSMSPRQYTRANALIALMHLVGLMCLIEEMLEKQKAP